MDLATCEQLAARYQHVKQQLDSACAQSQREITDVSLLAVSKRHSSAAIECIYELGQRAFGENYVQEGSEKAQALAHLDIEWHFIGPLQSNKTRSVAEHFHWLHTLDREKLAKRLNEQRPEHMPALNVLIQVNISDDPNKSGIAVDEITALAKALDTYPKLTLRGLMCIPAEQEESALSQDFARMQHAFEALKQNHASVDTLSMGMSADMNLAIAHGSTMVRIGSAIFGPRT